MNKSILLLLIVATLATFTFADAKEETYWKPRKEPERVIPDDEKIALTRDWLARDDPDVDSFNGFFPVWPAVLLSLSAFFVVLSFVSACVHLCGGHGKRRAIEEQNKEFELEQKKLAEVQERRKLAELRSK